MRFLRLRAATRDSAAMLLNEFPAHKKQHIKSFHGAKPKAPIEMTFKNRYYFTRIKNQITVALMRLKKTAALPISFARFASL